MENITKYRFQDPERAAVYCQELLKYGEKWSDLHAIGYACLYLGDTSFTLAQFDRGIEYLLRGIEVQRENHDMKLLISSYNIMAIIYMVQEDPLLAMDYFYMSMELAQQENDFGRQGILYGNLGAIYMDYKDYERADEFIKKGYALGQMEKQETFLTMEYYSGLNQSLIYYYLERYEEALTWVEKVEQKMLAEQEESQYFYIYITKIQILDKLGRAREASKLTDEVMKRLCASEITDIELYESLVDFVDYLIKEQRFSDLEAVINILTGLAVRIDLLDHWIAIYEALIKYYKAIGNRENQLQSYRGFRDYCHKMREQNRKVSVMALNNRFILKQENERRERLSQDRLKWAHSSRKDELTGIANRNGLNDFIERYFKKAIQLSCPFGLFILDIDFFKEYNDNNSHLDGDQCLIQVAAILKNVSKKHKGCFCARYGGDEFFFFVIGKERDEFEQIAGKIIQGVREQKIEQNVPDAGKYITVSIGGILKVPNQEDTITDYICTADDALYQVKRKNRDGYLFVEQLI